MRIRERRNVLLGVFIVSAAISAMMGIAYNLWFPSIHLMFKIALVLSGVAVCSAGFFGKKATKGE
jgi:hypothetical protein